MPIYVLHIDQITGNRFENRGAGGKVTSVYHNDNLTYCAPTEGRFTRAHAVEAANPLEGLHKAAQELSITLQLLPRMTFRQRLRYLMTGEQPTEISGEQDGN